MIKQEPIIIHPKLNLWFVSINPFSSSKEITNIHNIVTEKNDSKTTVLIKSYVFYWGLKIITKVVKEKCMLDIIKVVNKG